MIKTFTYLLVFFLILITALIKNSTKRIEDEIFVTNENIIELKKDLENTKLEHNYLSSAEKLDEFQNLYFEEELIKTNIEKIRIITQKPKKIIIEKLKLTNEK